MTKLKLQTKIASLKKEALVLRDRAEAVRAKYDRPMQWVKDEDFKAITRGRIAIQEELDDLNTVLNEIEDQEWADQMAAAYPDGQV